MTMTKPGNLKVKETKYILLDFLAPPLLYSTPFVFVFVPLPINLFFSFLSKEDICSPRKEEEEGNDCSVDALVV